MITPAPPPSGPPLQRQKTSEVHCTKVIAQRSQGHSYTKISVQSGVKKTTHFDIMIHNKEWWGLDSKIPILLLYSEVVDHSKWPITNLPIWLLWLSGAAKLCSACCVAVSQLELVWRLAEVFWWRPNSKGAKTNKTVICFSSRSLNDTFGTMKEMIWHWRSYLTLKKLFDIGGVGIQDLG